MEQELETIVGAEEDDSFEPGEQVEDRERYDNNKYPEPEESVDAFVKQVEGENALDRIQMVRS